MLAKDHNSLETAKIRPRGYKTINMLNSAEHGISTAHKQQQLLAF